MTTIVLLFAAGVFAWATAVGNRVSAGWSGIDVQRARPHDPIPRLVVAVRSDSPRTESFPDLFPARGVGLTPGGYFQLDFEAQAQAPQVTLP